MALPQEKIRSVNGSISVGVSHGKRRFAGLVAEMRCPSCQVGRVNESIAVEVAGQVKDVVARYQASDFVYPVDVLRNPDVTPNISVV